MSQFHYQFAVLGLPVSVTSTSLTRARSRLLLRYFRLLTLRTPDLPLAPPIQLLSTDDPRALAELHDPRF